MLRLISTTFIRQILAGILQIATLIILSRILGVTSMGQYTLAILLPTLLSQILSFGLQSANIYGIGRKKINENQALYVNFSLLGFISVFSVIFSSIVIYFFGEKLFPNVPVDLIYLSILSIPPLLFFTVLPSLFQAAQKFNIFNILCVVQPLIMLLVIALLVIFSSDIYMVLYAYTVANYISFLFLIFCILKYLKIEIYGVKEFLKKFGAYSLQSHLSNIVTLLNYRSTLFLLGYFTSPYFVGIYTVGLQLVEKLWLPSQAVSTILLPKLSHQLNDEEDGSTALLTLNVARLTFIFTALISLFFVILLPFFVELFFGIKYISSVSIALLLLPGILAWTPSRVLANDLAARGFANINLKNAVFVLTINIILSILLIGKFGFKGAAVATSIAYISDLLLRAYAFNRVTNESVFYNLLPRRSDFFLVNNLLKGFKNVG
jgi:O-antigen/teichoic acid export membrane protein